MEILVLSDTHIRREAARHLADLRGRVGHVDHIIHAGDYASAEVLDELRDWAPFTGVWGNVDGEAVRGEVRETEIVELAGYRIGVFHGHGDRGTTVERACEAFAGEGVDIVVFGHSHQPVVQTRNGVLLLNPGSPTDKRRERWFSYILLTLDRSGIRASLHLFPGE